jgi:hypothetical protein
MFTEKRNKLNIIFLIFCFSLPLFAREHEKITLTFKFIKGDTWKIRQKTNATNTFTTEKGKVFRGKENSDIITEYKVESVEPNHQAWVNFGNKSLKYKSVMKDIDISKTIERVNYNSSKDSFPSSINAQLLAATLEENILLKITPLGRVVDVNGLETYRNEMVKKIPESKYKEAVLANIKTRLTKDILKEQYGYLNPYYFNKPLSIGESVNFVWPLRTYSVILEGSTTLKSLDNGIAFLELEGDVKPHPNAEPIDFSLYKMKFEVIGKFNGKAQVDQASGKLIHSSYHMQMSGLVNLETQESPVPVMWLADVSYQQENQLIQ